MNLFYFIFLLGFLSQSDSAPKYLDIFDWSFLEDFSNEIYSSMSSEEEEDDSKQVFNLPQMDVSEIMTNLCSFGNGNPMNPDMESMSFVLHTRCKKISFPLTRAEKILSNRDFKANKNLAIFITGWMSSPEDNYVNNMAHAFDCRGDHNFLVLDSSHFIKTLYTWSAYNTEEIGRQVALALKKIIKNVPFNKIHLIGHSLGAHIAGYAGRYFTKYTGLKIKRITGLDPANPCFQDRQRGLQRGDAEFIDIIHSNSGVLGIKEPLGDADFYPEGFDPIQPGCIMIGCSHGRANEYFIESIYPGNEQNFLAARCTSLNDLKSGFCNGPKYPMGLAFSQNLKGNYFLHVNARKPYGKNYKYQTTALSNCRKC